MAAAGPMQDGGPSRPLRRMLPLHDLEPLSQGAFDQLSGLYSIVNAVRLVLAPVRPLRPREAKRLFDRGVDALSRQSDLAGTVLAGCDGERWRKLLGVVLTEAGRITGRQIEARQPFPVHARPEPEAMFVHIESAVVGGQPVLVEMAGPPRRHSVVVGYTPTRLRLFDSAGLAWLPRPRCPDQAGIAAGASAIDPGTLIVLVLPQP